MPPDRYNLENAKKALRHPEYIMREPFYAYENYIAKPTAKTLRKPLSEYWFRRQCGTGIEILEQDWDNLIILDALRLDIFKQENTLSGELNSVISQASTSLDFVQRNFEGKIAHDCIYVTANGWNEKLGKSPFFLTKKTYSNFKDRYRFYQPENVFKSTIETFSDYPDKRYIIHFMQPHVPYLGELAAEIRKQVENEYGIKFKEIDEVRSDSAKDKIAHNTVPNLLRAAEKGYITDQDLKKAYKENLNIVIPYVEKIHEKLGGKTVVTSDHGELLGDRIGVLPRKKYGHPGSLAVPQLRRVPWLELDFEERRTIRSERAIESEDVDGEKIKKSLEALGYR